MREDIRCSRCGSLQDLFLVTQPYSDDSDEGRMLVYCPKCRQVYEHRLIVHAPLAEMNPERFLDMYREGKTSSDPETASQIVFGTPDFRLVRSALEIMAARNLSDSTP